MYDSCSLASEMDPDPRFYLDLYDGRNFHQRGCHRFSIQEKIQHHVSQASQDFGRLRLICRRHMWNTLGDPCRKQYLY
jgi:hypothetical protein